MEVNHTKRQTRTALCGPGEIEQGVRQRLADKVSGNMAGIWLLVPEHLRLGTWDLLHAWTGRGTEAFEPRLAMQLVHEAALCVRGIREQRSLTQDDFELANGLPFAATDQAVHNLLDAHTVAEAEALQIPLGKIRRSRGHFRGKLLAIDPHRMVSYSKRRMRGRKPNPRSAPFKMAQTFFCLDADTSQPVCFTTGVAARTVTQATPALLANATQILGPDAQGALVVADTEHFTAELLDHVRQDTPFDLLVPMPKQKTLQKRLASLPAEAFTPRWAGFATTKVSHELVHGSTGPFCMMVQRFGERPGEYEFNSFVCTEDRQEVDALTGEYPKRWHIEEFFNANQALGWKRAGTQNLHVRCGQMTMGLFAQAAIHQLRQRLDEAQSTWDAQHLAKDLFGGLQGDIRVWADTIVVTYYNAPNAPQLRSQFEHMPGRLAHEGVDPRIPWLYDFKLDFRFK